MTRTPRLPYRPSPPIDRTGANTYAELRAAAERRLETARGALAQLAREATVTAFLAGIQGLQAALWAAYNWTPPLRPLAADVRALGHAPWLAELLTAADDALGRYARKQYDGPDAYNANAAAVEALTARLRAELLPDAPRDVTGRLLLRATDPDGLARRVVELRRLKRTVTVQAVDATGALSGEPLVLPLSTSGLTARLSAGGGAYGSWAVTLPETPEPQPRKSRARP